MEYVPVRVSTLRGDQKIDFNAYVKINDKYILYLRKGDSFEGTRLTRLKEKKLRKMFISNEEERMYRAYLSKNIEMAYDAKSGASIENRAAIVQGSQQSNTEEVMENPENKEAYDIAKDAAGRYVQFLTQESQAFNQIMNIENTDQSISHHGVTVSTLAVALAKKLGVTDTKQTQLLTLGALLHDFAHFHSTLNISRPLSQFSSDDLTTYKKHPFDGGQKVQDKRHFDQTVINIIMQHEECVDGSGFPQGLKESKIDPLALIVGSANALDRLITFEKVKRNEAVKQLMLNSVGKYPLLHIQSLGDIMKTLTPPPTAAPAPAT